MRKKLRNEIYNKDRVAKTVFKVLTILMTAAALFFLSGCEDFFTHSPLEFLQRDPSNLSEEQKIHYAELALEGGDSETLKEAYAALEGNNDPEIRLLASKVAVGASGINDAITDSIEAVNNGESVDTETMLQDIDTDMLKNAVKSMAVADADKNTQKTITSEDYLTTIFAAMVVVVKEEKTDLSTLSWENTTADKDGSYIEQSAYYLDQSDLTTEDIVQIESLLSGNGLSSGDGTTTEGYGSTGEYDAENFFNKTPGYGIHYHVTDNGSTDVDCKVWVVHQDPSDQPPGENHDFITTITESFNTSGYFSNSIIAGYNEQTIDEGMFFRYNSGFPSGNQVNYYFDAYLPSHFDIPTSWTQSYGVEHYAYELEHIGNFSSGGTEFTDCIRVNYSVEAENDYSSGEGYYVLSPGVGIVEHVFNRVDGSTARFEYIEHKQFSQKYSISGTVEDSGGSPVKDIRVNVGYIDVGIGDTTDASGSFSLQFYGPDILLIIGYDDDGDGSLDHDNPNNNYPIEHTVNNLTEDRSDITISLP